MMQREIKFRAWDFLQNEMIDSDSLAFEEYAPIKELLKDRDMQVFMQFTGLLDKNGVEIYEGDIAKWFTFTPEKNIEKSEVIFKDGSYDLKNFAISLRYILLEDKRELEVIGNIHENPEQLEQNNG